MGSTKKSTWIVAGIISLFVVVGLYKNLNPTPPTALEMERSKNQAIRNKQVEADNAAYQKELNPNTCKKGHGTSYIGEMKERTIKCGWGRPVSINRTIVSGGTREQWVYGNGNYLYFENGILIAMQN